MGKCRKTFGSTLTSACQLRAAAWGVLSVICKATVRVELHPFNERRLTRDLAVLCQRVEAAWPRLPDGRRLVLQIAVAAAPRGAALQEHMA